METNVAKHEVKVNYIVEKDGLFVHAVRLTPSRNIESVTFTNTEGNAMRYNDSQKDIDFVKEVAEGVKGKVIKETTTTIITINKEEVKIND